MLLPLLQTVSKISLVLYSIKHSDPVPFKIIMMQTC
jgi:hypothetical protein